MSRTEHNYKAAVTAGRAAVSVIVTRTDPPEEAHWEHTYESGVIPSWVHQDMMYADDLLATLLDCVEAEGFHLNHNQIEREGDPHPWGHIRVILAEDGWTGELGRAIPQDAAPEEQRAWSRLRSRIELLPHWADFTVG